MESSQEAAGAFPPAARPASSRPTTATEANVGSHQHMMPSSRIQMDFLPLRDYIMDLTDEEWKSFNDAMSNPVTKAQFFNVCSNIAKHVALSAREILMPSLARRLGEDPQLLVASEQSQGSITVLGSSPDNPSIIYIEDDEDVIVLNNGVLTKVAPKAGSRSPLRSCDELPISSRSSCGKRSSTSLQSTSLAQHGNTKEHILCSVQRSLTKLADGGLTPGSEEWIDVIAAEVADTRYSAFSMTSPDLHNSSPTFPFQKARSTEPMKNISLRLKTYMAQHKPSKTSSPVKENGNIVDSTTAEAMTTVMDEIETCLDVNESNHPAKKLIVTMKKAIKILACQSLSSNDIPALDANDLRNLNVFEGEKLGQNPGQGSSKAMTLERFSSEQLLTKAKKAISEVLTEKVRAVLSTSSARPCFSSIAVLESGINMEQKDLSSGCSPQPVHLVSSLIVDTFVEEMTSIIEFTECAQESHVTETVCEAHGESSVLLNNHILEAAKGLYDKVQVTMKQFFKNLLILRRKGMSTPDTEKMEAEALQPMDATSAQYPQLSGVQPTVTSSEQLLRPIRPALRKVASGECHLTQNQLDECTQDALRGVLTSLLSTQSEEPCSSSSALADMFVENVIFYLDESISSRSSLTLGSSSDNSSKNSIKNLTRISDSTSRQSSLACLQRKLSSDVFQTKALRTVSEAVLKTVRSHNSGSLDQHSMPERVQVSSFFFFPEETAVSDIESLTLDTANVDVDSAASTIANQFVTDLQDCVQSCHSVKMECEKSHKENFFSAASKLYGNLMSKMEEFFTDISFKGRSYAKQLVREAIAEKNFTSKCEHPMEDQNTHPVVDLKDTTDEVLCKIFRTYKNEMVSAECDIRPAVLSHDQAAIQQLEAYLASAESPNQAHGEENYTSPTKLIKKLSEDEFQSKAAEIVSDVLLLAIKTLTDSLDSEVAGAFISKVDPQISTLEVQNTAFDLVKEVADAVQTLVEDANVTVWSRTCETFQSLKKKLRNLFTKYHLESITSKTEDSGQEESFNKVLVLIEGELAQCVDLDHPEDLQMTRDSIIDNTGEKDVQEMKELQSPTSYSSTDSKSKLSKSRPDVLPGAAFSFSEAPAEAPPVQHFYIDMDDAPENECTPISQESIISIVNTISAELGMHSEDCSPLPTQDLTLVGERLERSLGNETMSSLAPDLVNRICHLFFKSQKRTEATKSVSDSLLLNMGESGKKDTVRQIVQLYAEETVKQFFLPCFNIPSSWTIDMGGYFQQASSSSSCPSFLKSLSQVSTKSPLRSPSQILQTTLQVFTSVMVRDVMNVLDLTLQSTGDLDKQTYQPPLPDSERVLSRPSSGEPRQMSVSEDTVTDSSNPSLTTSDDYTSLISMLVLRLLSELKDQESLTDDMLEISRELIGRVITEIDAALGTANSKACPHGAQVRKVFRAMYKDLLHEFGNQELLLRALMSRDPCFEKSLVTSLTREFTHTSVKPKLKEGKTEKRTLRLLPKISKIKAFLDTKFKQRRKEQSTDVGQNLDLTSAHDDQTSQCADCLLCVTPVASRGKATASTLSEKKPHKGFFSRIISRFSKKSSKTYPETLD